VELAEKFHESSAVVGQTDFDRSLVALCRLLEQWTAERQSVMAAAPDEFPPFNRKAAVHVLIFAALFGVGMAEQKMLMSWGFKTAQGFAALLMLIALIVGALLLVFEATGVLTKRFWRALFSTFKKDNYPFTQLVGFLTFDLSATEKLSPFSTDVLEAGEKRISIEESDLRERLSTGFGNPSLLVMLGLLAGLSSAWKSYYAEQSILNTAVFFGSIGALGLALQIMRMRVALFELGRCRGLVLLEIARRKAAPPASI
jgi:hypothetical protein